jgi:hypothetical protein
MNAPTRLAIAALLALWLGTPATAIERKVTPETIKEDLIAARCKAEAKQYYSIFQLKKRRQFEKNCIQRSYR